MKYPKYNKDQDSRCKLNESDIKEIVNLRKSGFSYKEIAEKFEVSSTTIRYWCNPLLRECMMENAKIHAKIAKKNKSLKQKREEKNKYERRKKILQPEFIQYRKNIRR